MWTVQLRLTETHDDALDALYRLAGSLRQAGRVRGREWPCWESGGALNMVVQTVEQGSLDPALDGHWSRKHRRELERLGTLTLTPLGPVPGSLPLCSCSHRSSLILYTDGLTEEAPLRCGECFAPVPASQLRFAKGEHSPADQRYGIVLAWETSYRAIDALQLSAAAGERFAEDQLASWQSDLSQHSRETASAVSEVTGRPTYVYLHTSHGESIELERARRCPSCDAPWLLEEALFGVFDFRCEPCGLLSNVACDVA